ncbi:phage tail protein [Xenorhabdus bovienii]|uniref:phage tail protein n=1 Tax=Xenorhabdus bovienii TaxID=40576 RepID=UPI0023B312C7|nr:phage tail protein [Xenorhabdus bovienii]MDE9489050.1 phage tail protein [Xenorhabdus bovienii]MDE9505504.1 phage tail protein [Xenorhabdus bovienii]MDE9546815.1 phage tail protein [Xenorhabdus bovienii]
MSTKYFALLTHAGTSKLENAATSGTKLEITHMAVGDGGGSLPVPNASQSKLINEKHRAEIDVLTIDPKKPNQIIAEQVLPEGQGGWWIREIGLFDKDGTLVAVGNCADLYKPQLQEQTVSMALPVSNSDWPGWVNELFSGLATRNYVREKIKDHAESRNHPDATLKEKGLVTLSNAVDSDNETHAATSKAVRTTYALATKAYDLANVTKPTDKWVPLTRKVNGKELKEDIVLSAADLDTYKKDEIDQRVSKVEALAETANKSATSAIQSADSKVPLTRKVNGKELLTDIELTALDVNAYNRPETDELIGIVKKQADTANQNATAALQSADRKVPLTRKVNNKELLADIDLNAADVGTYNKSEIDAHINKVEQLADTANKNATSAIQNADSKVPLTRKVNGKELLTDIELNATDIGTYNKVEINEHISKVEKLAETANQNATTAIQNADSKVPLTRKVNDKELSVDIKLDAADVGAYNKVETDDRISDVKTQVNNVNKLAETANHNATTAIQSADNKVPLTRKVNDKELSADIKLDAADVGAYNKVETDTHINIVKTQVDNVNKLAETANQNATTAIQNADSRVPLTRKVNDKELSVDIKLDAADVGAYNKVETDTHINIVKTQVDNVNKLAETANQNATTAIQNADSRVPLTRKVNGKELSADIQLSAADVGAYTKVETDTHINIVKTQVDNVNKLAETANLNATTAIQNADSKVPLIRKINDKELSVDIKLGAADVGAYTREDTDAHIKDVKVLAETANQNATTAIQNTDSKVPLTRKVNGKELSADIQLSAADIGAYSQKETGDRISDVKTQVDNVNKLAETANQNATTAIQSADSKVPLTRKVNDKELSADIKLGAADVGAYTKEDTDAHINNVKTQVDNVNKLAETANLNATTAIQNADSKVPLIRKINDKELSADIKLGAADVGAYTREDTDAHIKDVKVLAETANQNATTAIQSADSKVPLTRKVNDKELSADIKLGAADVGAYAKEDTDAHINNVKTQVDNVNKLAETANLNATTAIQSADSKVPLTRKVNDKELSADIKLNAADIGAYTKVETDDHINNVKVLAETANQNATTAIQSADSKVPLTRKVNDKELSVDIKLNAADVGAYTREDTDAHIKDVKVLAETANQNATTAIQNADSKVPLTRKVNGKELSADIQLSAADVGAYSQKETDDHINIVKTQVDNVNKLAETANLNATTAIQNADSRVPLTRKVNDKELSADIKLGATDVGAYTKEETDTHINNVKTQVDNVNKLAETANLNATTAIQNADSKVPLIRKINDKELSADIKLGAADVGAYTREDTDAHIKDVKVLAETANLNATTAIQSAGSRVPLTRKVNDKELSADIKLSAADVNAYSQKEIDDRISDVKTQVGNVNKLAETANQNATTAIQNADNKVPLTRKVNDKELSVDIKLDAADVGAYNKVETDTHISIVKTQVDNVNKLAETANQNATTAIQNADSKVPLTRKVNGKELSVDIQLSAADVGAYSQKETDDHINIVKTQVDNVNKLAETANQNATTAIQNADSKVPLTRKVNDKELSVDIKLDAADVGAYNKVETDTHINNVKVLAETANQNATTAIQSADSKVPLTRKVNGKELLTDIELNAADIGTYNRTEIDDRINKVDKLADTANQNATSAIQSAGSKVPLIRKVNGKELSTDIQLIADDVGAYNKKETDDRISIVDKLADTANKNAISAIQNVDSKVPLTRKVNGKELSTDIELTATDIDVYNKADVNILFEDVKELANNANNNADNKVPLTRTVNGKALLTDIKLQASDLNVYSKGEVDSRIEDVKELANSANNNADSRVPLTRTVNGKALLSDIKLIASDVGAYTKAETDLRISKVEDLAKSANNNASGRLEKGQNGADIPDKKAFVKNLGLSDLIGLGIESRRVGTDVTIIKLGDIIKINGLAVAIEPIGEVNSFVIGGVTYYTHYYKIQLPISLPNGIISCHASIVGNNFDNQQPGYLADVKTQRNNPNGVGVSKDTLTISVTTPQVGWVPHFDYQVIGY